MKPFNLEEYLTNPSWKIVTREGKPARIICTDAKFEKYQVLALITKKDGQESLATFDTSGKSCSGCNSHLDLFFAPVKKSGWINLYKINSIISPGPRAYDTEEEAESAAGDKSYYISTIKIEWEE